MRRQRGLDVLIEKLAEVIVGSVAEYVRGMGVISSVFAKF
jgi:hypothetical protein